MAGEPNELPEGGEGGGGWTGKWPGEWPAEMPVDPTIRFSLVAVLREVLQLRSRISAIENRQVTASVLGAGVAARAFFWPNELPEGGEGGGGGGGWPGEFPGENPAELPVDLGVTFIELATRINALESRLVLALEGIQARLDTIAG
jgi:hypothetical protein